MWRTFQASFAPAAQAVWTERQYSAQVHWEGGAAPVHRAPVHIRPAPDSLPYVLGPDGGMLGRMNAALNPANKGLLRVSVSADAQLLLNYIGPDDLWLT